MLYGLLMGTFKTIHVLKSMSDYAGNISDFQN